MHKDLGELSFSESACVRRDVAFPVFLENETFGIFLVSVCRRHHPAIATSQKTLSTCSLTALPIPDISLLFLPLTVSFLLTQNDKYYKFRR